MSSVTNTEWLTDLASAVAALAAGSITQEQFATQLLSPTNGWIGIAASDQVLADKVTSTVSAITLRDEDFDAWAAGTPSGGPYGNGEYPLHTLAGGTIIVPSIQKLLTLVQHGADAKTGIAFSVVGGYNANELLEMIGSPGVLVIDPSNVSGWAENAPTNDSTFILKKNGAAWGTVTFEGGYSNSVYCSFSNTSLANGDAVMLYAPASIDPTLQNFTITIPGV